jgi:PAS domain-containing protein
MMPAMASLAAKSESQLQAQLQATLNVIPAYTWYALSSGTLTFVNKRTADYLGLPKDHPLRFGIDPGRVRNARPKQQVVIYAHSGQWWVQPRPPYLGS